MLQSAVRLVNPVTKSSIPAVSAAMSSASSTAATSASSDSKPAPKPLTKILIANRGEIACRIMKTAKKMGVATVAVYSEADRDAMHVQMADEAFLIGPPPAAQSYLQSETILDVAEAVGAQGIHPGYGFLSENAGFAAAVSARGLTWIGPPASAIESMGSKSASKHLMEAAGVPVVPGYHGDNQDVDFLAAEAEKMGFPVLIKAVLGGGGKGMRIVNNASEVTEALAGAQREALASFGDDRVLVEKYVTRPRHIELQVFADTHGNVVHLHERDCSLQRRHQKVIEEAPAPSLDADLRKRMGDAAVAAAKAVGYEGAGTVEFILDTDTNEFYFMEMNTRLQVEHPVTEAVTRQDLVEWQLRVAGGETLPMTQEEIGCYGHAFEARIYAENPDNNFLPGAGDLKFLSTPEEWSTADSGVRVDTGVGQGDAVSVHYDPMIAKLITWGPDRSTALRSLTTALSNFKVSGLPTNITFLSACSSHPEFAAANIETGFIPTYHDDLLPPPPSKPPTNAVVLATLATLMKESGFADDAASVSADPTSPFNPLSGFQLNLQRTRVLNYSNPGDAPGAEPAASVHVTYGGQEPGEWTLQEGDGEPVSVSSVSYDPEMSQVRAHLSTSDGSEASLTGTVVEMDDGSIDVWVGSAPRRVSLARHLPAYMAAAGGAAAGSLTAPMPGKVVKLLLEPGTEVKEGDALLVLEAMKMEHTIRAPADGLLEHYNCEVAALVDEKTNLVSFKPTE